MRNVASKRNMTWTTSSFVITAKMKVTRDASLRITRKTSSSIWSHRYSRYDKCHIKTEYDLNYKSISNHCKTKVARDTSLRVTRKLHHQFGARCSLYDKCHNETEYDMNYKFICDNCKNKSHSKHKFKNYRKNIHHQFGAKGVHCITNITLKRKRT